MSAFPPVSFYPSYRGNAEMCVWLLEEHVENVASIVYLEKFPLQINILLGKKLLVCGTVVFRFLLLFETGETFGSESSHLLE